MGQVKGNKTKEDVTIEKRPKTFVLDDVTAERAKTLRRTEMEGIGRIAVYSALVNFAIDKGFGRKEALKYLAEHKGK